MLSIGLQVTGTGCSDQTSVVSIHVYTVCGDL